MRLLQSVLIQSLLISTSIAFLHSNEFRPVNRLHRSALILPETRSRNVALIRAASSDDFNLLLTDAAVSSSPLQSFQDNHTFLQGILLTIVLKLLVGEVRRRIEKPILDEAGRRIRESATEQLTPDTEQIDVADWAKLAVCIVLDLAGDASELIPFLGEFTDLAFAPAEAGLLQVLFKSPAISAFGFFEEILPFTDVIPTFTLSWVLATLFPTTPISKALRPDGENKTKPGQKGGN